jgi:hypothetical protein
VDLGDHPAEVIPLREAGSEQLCLGDRVIAVVTQSEGHGGRVVLSLRRSRNRRQSARLEHLEKRERHRGSRARGDRGVSSARAGSCLCLSSYRSGRSTRTSAAYPSR